MLYHLSRLFHIFVEILQNPHMYGPGHPLLVLRCAESGRLLPVGEEAALGFRFI